MSPAIVTVRGEAQLEVPPDRATLSFTVHATGQTAESVRAHLATSSARMPGLLEDFAAGIVESSSTGLQVRPNFNNRKPPKITGYVGSFSTAVVVGDFEVLSSLVLALTSMVGAQVDGPWWSLSPGHPSAREARIAAITDARSRAADYAAAFDLEVGQLIEISDLEPGYGRPMMAQRRSKHFDEEASALDLAPADQTVTGQVTVRFELQELTPAEGVGLVSEQ